MVLRRWYLRPSCCLISFCAEVPLLNRQFLLSRRHCFNTILYFSFIMARILAIDYGGKRTGLAVTDPLQIIATGLATIDSKDLLPYLENYFLGEQVELILIGLPKNWDESD